MPETDLSTVVSHGPQSPFERIRRVDEDGVEYWTARDLGDLLQYSDYRDFTNVVAKARVACQNSGQAIEHHFVEVPDMVVVGSGATRERHNVWLTRYACYLAVQAADPSKIMVAEGMTYFAIQTRRQELEDERRLLLREEMAKHNKNLAGAAKDAGVVDPKDYAIFTNFGYKALYGGLSMQDIHARKGLKKSQKILDHMGSSELAANLFRATQTEEKLRREHVRGKSAANHTHAEVGKKVRDTIRDLGGTMPEDMPCESSIKSLATAQKNRLTSTQESEDA